MHFIIGTAGHVDHGKTTLIRALTGIETDRLREEKERGLSIVPGFAHMRLPDNRVTGIVDVPGHERFLKNMLAGVSGVDIVMLVVAADEGVMPQTIEHLRVLELLQVQRGIIVLTKCDAVDTDWLALAREDVRERLLTTLPASTLRHRFNWENAPMLEVSAARGQGLEELKRCLAQLCDELEAESNSQRENRPFRMAIDRAFSVSGFGTVVTGSALQGTLSPGDSVEVWEAGAREARITRVRSLEVHGESAQLVEAGRRAAINLAGLSLDEATRGGVVAQPESLSAVSSFDARVQVIPGALRPLKDGASLRVHLGTAEIGARLLLPSSYRKYLQENQSTLARVKLEAPLACVRGDRFVLREIATERVVGGGIVLDPQPILSRGEAVPYLEEIAAALESNNEIALAEILLRRAGLCGMDENRLRFELNRREVVQVLSTLHNRGARQTGEHLLDGKIASEAAKNLHDALQQFHAADPLQPVMPRESLRAILPREVAPIIFEMLLAEMARAGEIVIEAAGVRLSSHRVQLNDDEARMRQRILEIVQSAAWQPPTLDEIVGQWPVNERDAVRRFCFALIKSGVLVRVGDWLLTRERIEEGAERLHEYFRTASTLSVAQGRELLETSRKWAVPLLEFYDRNGVTRREGEVRVGR